MSKKSLVPNWGQAILKPVEEGEKSYGNIVVPDTGQTKLSQAHIVDIAPIYNFNLGVEVPSKFQIGDLVLIPPMGAQKHTLDREEYYICGVTDLLASIKEE